MKVTCAAVILFLALFSNVQAKPSAKPEGKDEVETVHLDVQPIVDTGVFDGPFSNPFDGLFESLAGVMSRIRHQMDSILTRLPTYGNSTDHVPAFSGLDFPDLDLNKGNTTSVTKIIDGHKVVINETEYKQDGGDFGGAYFKVRIIDVKPDSSELTTEREAEEVTHNQNRESVENSVENEISKNKESEAPNFDNIETFDEVEISSPNKERTDANEEWSSVEPLESFEDNEIDFVPHTTGDLSHDIYVNKLLTDKGAPTNPDAEVFSVDGPYESSRGPMFEKLIAPR